MTDNLCKYYLVALTKGDDEYLRPRVFTPKEYEECEVTPGDNNPSAPSGWHYEIIAEFELDIIPGCG